MTPFYRALSYAMVIAAGLGLYQVPHAIFYAHPELVVRAFFRSDLDG